MGEYATYNGQHVKIGTCEDMYYLRADQAHLVQRERGNVDPLDAQDQAVIRFRFPWPDEDGTEPGAFDPFGRAVGVWDAGGALAVPPDVEHFAVQFTAKGYNVCLPCPEGGTPTHGLTVHRNGFAGAVQIVQQAYRHGVLALICQCGGCGARYNLPTFESVEPVIVACRAEADRHGPTAVEYLRDASKARWWHTVADRIAAGYGVVHAQAVSA